jgi:hypothetical protein
MKGGGRLSVDRGVCDPGSHYERRAVHSGDSQQLARDTPLLEPASNHDLELSLLAKDISRQLHAADAVLRRSVPRCDRRGIHCVLQGDANAIRA